MKTLKQSQSAEKSERGTIRDFLAFILLQSIKQVECGALWRHLKTLEKKSHRSEKN